MAAPTGDPGVGILSRWMHNVNLSSPLSTIVLLHSPAAFAFATNIIGKNMGATGNHSLAVPVASPCHGMASLAPASSGELRPGLFCTTTEVATTAKLGGTTCQCEVDGSNLPPSLHFALHLNFRQAALGAEIHHSVFFYGFRENGIVFLFVNTDFNHTRIMEAKKKIKSTLQYHVDATNIRLMSIPAGLEPHDSQTSDFPKLLRALENSMTLPLDKLIEEINEKEEQKVTCLIVDLSVHSCWTQISATIFKSCSVSGADYYLCSPLQ
eukprot:Gb_17582 [translate_table: standard]